MILIISAVIIYYLIIFILLLNGFFKRKSHVYICLIPFSWFIFFAIVITEILSEKIDKLD